jgi:exodeoxyribonuclease VII large subunit
LSEALHDLRRRLQESARRQFADRRQEFSKAEMRLRLLSPLNVLQRGYSITVDDLSGTVVRAASQVRPGQKLRTRLGEGEVWSVAQD